MVPGQRGARGSQVPCLAGGKRCCSPPQVPMSCLMHHLTVMAGPPTCPNQQSGCLVGVLTSLFLSYCLDSMSKHITFPISSRRVDATDEPQNLYICIPGLLYSPWMLPSPQKMPELRGAAGWGNQAKAASSALSPLPYAGSTTGPYDAIPELACWLTAGFLPF